MTDEAHVTFDNDEISDFRKICDADMSLLIADKYNLEKNTIKYQLNKTLIAILYSIQSTSKNGGYKYEIHLTDTNQLLFKEILRVLQQLGYKTSYYGFNVLCVTWNK